ncbi:MAG: DNA repair protein RecN [Proteobacteria bacterium]|nr:DNA repair protein RecN [Pseudomonadota bacterium]
MLLRLFIQNLATVEKQIVEFDSGFTALTGETGAGKSIIIKAINLILGEKCPKDLIRSGESFLSVEAVFAVDGNPAVLELLSELDIEHDGELTVRRKVHRTGKSSVFINDYSSTLSRLSRLGDHLIDLHGQHSQQSLLQPATHIDYLDQFSNLRESVMGFQALYHELVRKRKTRQELEQNAVDRARKIDFIRFQMDEIDEAGFTEGEESQLFDEFSLLSHGEQIIEALSPIAGWNAGQNSPLDEISAALHPLDNILKIAPQFKEKADELRSGLIILEEAVADVNHYLGNLEINPQRLDFVNERLSQLDKLKRKYGGSLAEIVAFRELQNQELEKLENLEISLTELEKEIEKLSRQVEDRAGQISAIRNRNRKDFETTVLENLKVLGLERSLFEVNIEPFPQKDDSERTYSSKGQDRVEFRIATNPGNPLKPLAKVASGGEVSRIMLAIKTTLNEDISFGTMVFDEVDSGISGRVAETVGFKLVELGETRQIICITHSPQIASKALVHLRVEKTFNDDSSRTSISRLQDRERIEEIARFLGGNEISEKTLSVAQDMLKGKRRKN